MDTGIKNELSVHFHTLHEEKWQASATWPPHANSTRLFFADQGQLLTQASSTPSTAAYQVSFSTNTGQHSRFERLGALPVENYYDDWSEHEKRLLCFSSEPTNTALELSGHLTVRLNLS
jgi:predicted acyl esterase